MGSRKQYYIVGDAQVVAQYTNDNIFGLLAGLSRIVPLKFDRESTFQLINKLARSKTKCNPHFLT